FRATPDVVAAATRHQSKRSFASPRWQMIRASLPSARDEKRVRRASGVAAWHRASARARLGRPWRPAPTACEKTPPRRVQAYRLLNSNEALDGVEKLLGIVTNAVLEDRFNFANVRNIRRRVAGHDDEIGCFASFNRAGAVGDAQ